MPSSAGPVATVAARARLRWLRAALGSLIHPRSALSPKMAWLVLGAMLAASWALTHAFGGAARVAPHWFYVPILVAAFRFGQLGAAAVAVGAAVLAGPLTPADADAGVAQQTSDWVTRGSFFVVLGQLMAAVGSRYRGMEADIRRHDEIVRQYEMRLEPHERAAEHARVRSAAIRRVLSTGTMSIVFQPVVDLRTGAVAKVEALARFATEPVRPPDVWFAEAWELGLGLELEIMAFAKAVEERRRLPADLDVAINLSPQTILSAPLDDLVGDCPCERLVFEITEHAQIADYDAFAERLGELRARGVKLSVDDVGAGFASFRHILILRPEFVKLDRSLVSEIDSETAKLALARGIVACARGLGAQVVAEGLETPAEVAAVRDIAVTLGQGYRLGRPVRADELALDRHGPRIAVS